MAIRTILPALFLVAVVVYGAIPSDADAQKTTADPVAIAD